jgi:hypothetical protein
MNLVRRRRSGGWSCLGLIGLTLILASCGNPAPSPPTSTATITPSPIPAPSLKPMIQGLIDRDGPPAASLAGTVTTFVVNVAWSELQPMPFGPLATNNPIDRAIAAARSLGPGMGVKIRLLTGIDAPGWAKQIDGGPVSVYSTLDHVAGTVGRFWTDDFGKAYADLWDKLAATYDNVPEIREITASRCMLVFAETFERDTSDPSTVRNLLAAGFSTSADQTCIKQEIAEGTAWRHTRVGVAFNPYQEIFSTGAVRTNEPFTLTMMQYCRAQLGAQCVLENNSIRWPPLGAAYADMYSAMQALGAPLSFQTATEARIGDLDQTLAWAVTVGADAVELPAGYQAVSAATLQGFASRLRTNPT